MKLFDENFNPVNLYWVGGRMYYSQNSYSVQTIENAIFEYFTIYPDGSLEGRDKHLSATLEIFKFDHYNQ